LLFNDPSQQPIVLAEAASIEAPASLEPEADPHDIPGLKDSRVVGTRGVVIRTHFDSNDEPAWNVFLTSLEELERKSLADVPNIQPESSSDGDDDEESENEEMAEAGPPPITYESDAVFTVVDPIKQEAYQPLRDKLSNASNITLLRLFNDVSIALAPSPSASARIKPGHRLIDEDGFQEIYSGGRIWVWDHQSAKDQTLRLVSPEVFVYGDATGDSWRVRAAHMWELQLNLDDGMRIDFSGGVGPGWDMNERARNLKESTSYVFTLESGERWQTVPMINVEEPNMPLYIETPLIYSPIMSSRLGYDVYLKICLMQNLQPSQSFKYRGISLFVSQAIKEHGPKVRIVAATSGSAGIALAWIGKYLDVRVSVFIPASAVSVQTELGMAGAEVVVGGTDYADALLAAKAFCETKPKTVLMSSYDHPTLWEGHSTMIHEIARQLPNKSVPDAIVCNVGGGGLLGGILRGVNELTWDQTKLIAVETHGANSYHLSLLANSLDPAVRALVPDYVALFKSPTITDHISQAEVTLAMLPAITSEASSLGARSPSQTTLEIGLARTQLAAVSIPDSITMHATLGFLDEQKLLVEVACGATLSPAYTPGLLEKLLPKASEGHRPVIVFIVCGGSKATFQDMRRYRNIIMDKAEIDKARSEIMIDSVVGLA
ncbi:unnamed protein product, partial [Rhizoctonia solani]